MRHTGRALNDCWSERSFRSWAWSVITCGDETGRRMSSLSFPFLSFPLCLSPLANLCARVRFSVYTHIRMRACVRNVHPKLYRPSLYRYSLTIVVLPAAIVRDAFRPDLSRFGRNERACEYRSKEYQTIV